MYLAHHELESSQLLLLLLDIPGHWGRSPLGQRQPFQNPHSIALGLEAVLQCTTPFEQIVKAIGKLKSHD